ncbi:MAG: HAD family phosphatase [Clostridia bacterium]|nr:HAD family phosphatase [Clostridia bacterium]
MIKNIVFDVNGVLLKTELTGCLDVFNWSYNVKEEIKNILKSELGGQYLDGKMSRRAFLKLLLKNYPENRTEINQVFTREFWRQIMPPNDDTFNLLKELKNKNYNIYILSNMNKDMADYFRTLHNVEEHLNGAVFSYEVGVKKPTHKIYQFLLNKYDLNPLETLFIDDIKENTKTAQNLGMKIINFKNPETGISQIKSLLSEGKALER